MTVTITSLRRLATEQLLQYRRNRHHLTDLRRNIEATGRRDPAARAPASPRGRNASGPGGRELRQMRIWVRAIDRVRAKLRREQPQKERFMSRCFGLDAGFPNGQTTRARMIEISMELHVSESTAYKWRETVLDLVLFAAIEAGALAPFGEEDAAER